MAQLRSSSTPNPNSLKFTLKRGTFIETGMESFSAPSEAAGHDLGRRLFEIAGVSNVFILPQFLTVTKTPTADWDEIIPQIEDAVAAHLGQR